MISIPPTPISLSPEESPATKFISSTPLAHSTPRPVQGSTAKKPPLPTTLHVTQFSTVAIPTQAIAPKLTAPIAQAPHSDHSTSSSRTTKTSFSGNPVYSDGRMGPTTHYLASVSRGAKNSNAYTVEFIPTATAVNGDNNLVKPSKEEQSSTTPIGVSVAVLAVIIIAVLILVVWRKRQQGKFGRALQARPTVLHNNLASRTCTNPSNQQPSIGVLIDEPNQLQDEFQGNLEDDATARDCSVLTRGAILESSYAVIGAERVRDSSKPASEGPLKGEIRSSDVGKVSSNQSDRPTDFKVARESSSLKSEGIACTYGVVSHFQGQQIVNAKTTETAADTMDEGIFPKPDESAYDNQMPLQLMNTTGLYSLAQNAMQSVGDGAYANALSPLQPATKTTADQDLNADQYDNFTFVSGAGKQGTTSANPVESVYDNEVKLSKPTTADEHTYNTLREITEQVPAEPTSLYDVLDRSQFRANDVISQTTNPKEQVEASGHPGECTYDSTKVI
ncbi:uncharacterized protein LOC135826105 [Sycon ciliatum]|uniref:uncharacterized protein LOC135826105 n=1 Tax=Sycon ciliatum TaxID=27933 RepID=UPI0031F63C15